MTRIEEIQADINIDRLAIIREVAKMYGIEVIECGPGEGGFYDGDKKIEFSETDFWDGLNEDYFKSRRIEERN